MRAGCPRLVSSCVVVLAVSLLLPNQASAQAVIKMGDDYFDRLMRQTIVETTQTPGHFVIAGKRAANSLVSAGILGEGRVLDTKYIDLGVVAGLLWYRYEVGGLEDDVIGNINQALGFSAYFLPDAPVNLNLYAGYNLYYGANVPYGASLPPGSERPDSNLELQPFLYLTGAAYTGTKGIFSMMFRNTDGRRERSKTYASLSQSIGPVDLGIIYDQLKSSASRGFVLDGNAPELYEISAFARWNYRVWFGHGSEEEREKREKATGKKNDGGFMGYLTAKVGKSLNLVDGRTFDREWADKDTTFYVAEAAYWWVGGLSYSGRNGTGWKLGVDFGGKNATSETVETGPFVIGGKQLHIEATYMKNYVASDLFGPRVIPWAWNFSIALR